MTLTFDEFITVLPDISLPDRDLLKLAFQTAEEAHDGQKRSSGEDYFIHCIEVARILGELNLETAVVAAGLMHDVVEDTELSIDDLERMFGVEIAGLVDAVTKMDQIDLETTSTSKGKTKLYRNAEFLRKTLLAMSDDVRVILIKLADRLHNMRTLGHLSHERQMRLAGETLDIFAPLASRLGIWQMKWELEDLSFRYLNPDAYRKIAELIDERRSDRDHFVSLLIEELNQILAENEIEGEVSGRSKHIYSIWRKMKRKELPLDQLYDVRAVRVIVPTTASCYQVLGIIHQAWRPVAGEFDDYIAAPKDNFYQSLHTAVYLEDNKTLEIQIRTPDMHRSAEYGIAAHWRYKESGVQHTEAFQRRVEMLREMVEVGQSLDDNNPIDFMDAMKSDAFEDRVYAFTPRGDVIDLPAGSTPIDFAYHVHTDVGDRCRGAKVNGKLMSLDYVLQVGDRVEVLTSKRGGPSRDWLNPNLKFLRTKRAQAKVRQWFRKQDRVQMVSLGREILERELKRLGVDQQMNHEQIAKLFDIDKVDDLLAQVGFADIHPQHIASKVLDLEGTNNPEPKTFTLPRPTISRIPASDTIHIQGAGGMLTSFGRCCNPVQGNAIIGYITRGRGVTIHRKDCSNILNTNESERLLKVEWGGAEQEKFLVPIVVSAYDREGLMRDIGGVMAEEKINMQDLNIQTNNNIATFKILTEVKGSTQLSRMLARIAQLPNIIDVHRQTN